MNFYILTRKMAKHFAENRGMKEEVNHVQVEGEEISLWRLSRSMGVRELAQLLDDTLNVISNDFSKGFYIGQLFTQKHPTIQGSLVNFAMGILSGISDFSVIAERKGWTEEEAIEYMTDPRNRTAIDTAFKVSKMRDNGELKDQPLI